MSTRRDALDLAAVVERPQVAAVEGEHGVDVVGSQRAGAEDAGVGGGARSWLLRFLRRGELVEASSVVEERSSAPRPAGSRTADGAPRRGSPPAGRRARHRRWRVTRRRRPRRARRSSPAPGTPSARTSPVASGSRTISGAERGPHRGRRGATTSSLRNSAKPAPLGHAVARTRGCPAPAPRRAPPSARRSPRARAGRRDRRGRGRGPWAARPPCS